MFFFSVYDTFGGQNFIGVSGWWGEEKIFCTIINVYAPCDFVGKKNLWRKLLDIKSQHGGGLWCDGGDFNSVKYVS